MPTRGANCSLQFFSGELDTKLLIITVLIYFDKLMVMDFTSPQFYSVPCHYLELFYFVQNYVPVASHGPLPSVWFYISYCTLALLLVWFSCYLRCLKLAWG